MAAVAGGRGDDEFPPLASRAAVVAVAAVVEDAFTFDSLVAAAADDA